MTTKKTQNQSQAKVRPPVVAVLGHVDHGKTTLLDAIRKTNLADREAGGITQHIGAYQVKHDKRLITFIDTPGHVAFAKMRSRGGQIADLVILVVAADDGVKPQTKESYEHIKKAGVPFIVAINKIDKDGASSERVKKELAQIGVLVEGYGGDVVVVEVSAKEKTNLDELLEMVFLSYDMDPVEADPKSPLEGVVIESFLDKRRGPVATVLVKNGQIKIGQKIMAGPVLAKVKAMNNDLGKLVKVAVPGQPVEILGFKDVPSVGQIVKDAASVKTSEKLKKNKPPVTLPPESEDKIRLVIKADTQGTLQALKGSLPEDVYMAEASVGQIGESDILLAQSTQAMVVGYGVKLPKGVKKLAETEGVKVKTYKIIYKLLDDVSNWIEDQKEKVRPVVGKLEVLAEFDIDDQHIAGCKVKQGKVKQGASAKLIKNQEPVAEAKIISLKQHQQDVKELGKGEECGIILKPDLDFSKGDTLIIHPPKKEK